MSFKKQYLERCILIRLFGGKHTAIENLKKGFPSHVRGDVDDAVKELIKNGFILPKKTSYGLQVSLNPRMIAEIERILEI